MSFIDRRIVLRLNRVWKAIGYCSVRDAFTAMNSSSENLDIAALGIDVTYDQDGKPYYEPVSWERWLKLSIRNKDFSIQTPTMSIRVPTIIIAMNYDKNRLIDPKFTNEAIFERDEYICQYSGKKLPKSKLDRDHIIPKSRGGKDDWENVVTCEKGINRRKKDKTPEEAGLTLIRKPRKPLPRPVASIIPCLHKDWEPFVIKPYED